MPNGQTDIFRVARSEFAQLLNGLGSGTVRGLVLGAEGWRDYSAAEAIRTVEEAVAPSLLVEEQHGDSYIVHIGPDTRRFLIEVSVTSPLHAELQRIHAAQR